MPNDMPPTLRRDLRRSGAVTAKVKEWLEKFDLDVIEEAIDDLVANVLIAIEDSDARPVPTPTHTGVCLRCGAKGDDVLQTDHSYVCTLCADVWAK